MSKVSIYLFSFPEITWEGDTFDTVIMCIDKLSGWIIGEPCQNKGLTSEKVAKIMLNKWDFFWVPDEVHSDNGSHFIGG